MPPGKIAAVALFSLLTLAAIAPVAADDASTIVVDPAIASMTADQLVEARQAAMKADGGALKEAMKGGTGDAAIAKAKTLIQNFTNLPALFKEGSITDKSHALPIIWEQFDQFSAIFATARAGAVTMLTAAEAGDSAAYVAGAKSIAGACGECHQTYRGK